jgi:lipid II:glycine glycyltransferase (peptidoglycan interpeptide bridge formation enzyme)
MNNADRTIRMASLSDQSIWNSHVHHPLQSWEWGEFRKEMGIDVSRIIEEKSSKEINCWQLTFHKIPHTSFTVGYFPKGPLPSPAMITALQNLGKEKHALYIQLEPDVRTPNTHIPGALQPSHRPLFTKFTFEMDLTKSEDDLLKEFHSKTRYNIRVAQKHNVTIQEDNSDNAFNSYLTLSQETTSRQGFYAHSAYYHRTMWNILHKAGIAHLFTATYNKEVVATWILFVWNKRLYYPYGASSRDHREIMAPTLLLWEIVRWAKQKGIQTFDLWGAMGPNPDTNDPWYGFHRFKQGFNPTLVEFIGSFDLIIQPTLYKLYCALDSIRWTLLKLKAKR